MHINFADVNGVNTRYFYEGSGYPLLLIHGVGVGAETWFRNVDALGEHLSVFAPDLLYHGFTGPTEYQGGSPVQQMVDHLTDLVDLLGLVKLAVCGSSLGALLAANLFFRMPQRVEKLILVGTGSCFNSEDEIYTTHAQSLQNALSAIANPTLESCRRRLGNICYDPSVVPEEILLDQLTSYALPGFFETHERVRRAIMDPEYERPASVRDRLEQITVPTLVITGKEDPRAIHQRTVEGVKRLPDSKLITIEKCGHLPYIEHPELFNRTVLDFVT